MQNTFIATVIFLILTIIVYFNENILNIIGGNTNITYTWVFLDWVLLKLNNDIDQPVLLNFDNLIEKQKYHSTYGVFRINTSIRKRKLFLTQLQHLTNLLKNEKLDNNASFIVINTGGSTTVSLNYLLDLFPNMKWIGFDQKEFKLNVPSVKDSYIPSHLQNKETHYDYPEKQIYLYPNFTLFDKPEIQIWDNEKNEIKTISITKQNIENLQKLANENIQKISHIVGETKERVYFWCDELTSEIALNLKKLTNHFPLVLYWGDILDSVKRVDQPVNVNNLINYAKQYNWICSLQPSYFMTYFKSFIYENNEAHNLEYLAASNDNETFSLAKTYGVDFLEDFKMKKFTYFAGKQFLQPFDEANSVQISLQSNCLNVKSYDGNEFEEKLFYFNQYSRKYIHRVNANSDPDIGFDHCNDCAIENNIWENYNTISINKTKVKQQIISLSNYIKNDLFIATHGKFFQPYTEKSLRKLATTYKVNW